MKWWYVSRLRKFHLKFQKFIRVPPYDFEKLMSTFLQYKYIGCLILGQINFWKKFFGPRSPQFSGITTPRLRFAQEHSAWVTLSYFQVFLEFGILSYLWFLMVVFSPNSFRPLKSWFEVKYIYIFWGFSFVNVMRQ